MRVTCEVVGERRHELDLDAGATYGDVIRAVGLTPGEASALVDGSPVPEDRPVDSEEIQILRLIKGGRR